MRRHHELRVWQDAIKLVRQVYDVTGAFPADERFGLISQMRRAAISIPSNIAEGAARQTQREFHQFLIIARGSLAELETQVVIAEQLGYLATDSELMRSVNKVFGVLGALIKSQQLRFNTQ